MKPQFAAAAVVLSLAGQAQAGVVFSQASYTADVTFRDALAGTTMTMAYDGTSYWSVSGGGPSGVREARYDASGNVTGTYSPGLDFRSIFTDASGKVYARGFNTNTIYKQTAPGAFSSVLSLTGGTLNAQSSVVLNSAGQYVAMNAGTVNVWSASGNYVNSFTLAGFGGGQNVYPQNRGIAAAGNYLFSYFNQVISAWDYTGALVDSATLTGAGTSFDSNFSLSYANNRFFIVDSAGSTWRGFDTGLGGSGQTIPEPGALALVLSALGGLALVRRGSKKA